MTIEPHGETLRLIGALFDTGTIVGLTDGQLLERFASRKDEGAELAFADLVRRHGPMVLRVCRTALRDEHDAHDAFQATFLVLVRKASTLRASDTLGPWLHAVALRVTACARSEAARRQAHERRSGAMAARCHEDDVSDDQDTVLHQEVGQLPERYRTPLVLCDLQGLTHEEAARQLGWPVGTVKSRQARGRERLRARLIRRGLAPSAGIVAIELSMQPASSAVPAALAEATVQLAMRAGLGKTAITGLLAASVASLVEGGLRTMWLTKIKLVAVTILTAAAVTTSVVAFSGRDREGPRTAGTIADQGNDPKGKDRNETPQTQILAELAAANRPTPEEDLDTLLHEYDADFERTREALRDARPGDDRQALVQRFSIDLDRIKGRFLDLAVRNPGTNAAEQALIWLANHVPTEPEGDKARELLARDHARSDRLSMLFGPKYTRFQSEYSKSAEDLLRNALDRNSYREIRGLACYWLAVLLTYQAEAIRAFQLDSPAEFAEKLPKLKGNRADIERLMKKDPKALEDEATRLYERVIAEFSNIENNDNRYNFAPPLQLGSAAIVPLDELRRHSVGKPAPEVVGTDLEGKSMRLSDFRGKVVVLFTEAKVPLRAGRALWLKSLPRNFTALAQKFEGRPLALLGVVSGPDLDAFKQAVKDVGPAAQFWWDPDVDGKPGPIRTAWNSNDNNFLVIDPRGFIRYTHLMQGWALEKAVEKVFEEIQAAHGRAREK